MRIGWPAFSNAACSKMGQKETSGERSRKEVPEEKGEPVCIPVQRHGNRSQVLVVGRPPGTVLSELRSHTARPTLPSTELSLRKSLKTYSTNGAGRTVSPSEAQMEVNHELCLQLVTYCELLRRLILSNKTQATDLRVPPSLNPTTYTPTVPDLLSEVPGVNPHTEKQKPHECNFNSRCGNSHSPLRSNH